MGEIPKKTICLAMIVKNEAHLIIDTFKHLEKFMQFDYWVINDNGSTDGTQALIKDYFKEKGIPGELDETSWKDFAYNRTLVFQLAYKKTDYVFVWDADDEIYGNFIFPTNLSFDSYKFIFGNDQGLRYCRCQLFNNHKRWHYVGVLHEYPACLEASGPTFDVSGDYYFISGRRGDRSKDPNKYLKDAKILEKAFLEAYEKKDPIYNRYCFYTAQSYNSCNMHEESIKYYKKVLQIDNWIQEKYVSCIEIYDQYDKLKRNEEGLIYLVESHKYCKTRIEGIYRLIKYYCIHGQEDVAYAYYTLIQNYYENQYIHDDISNNLFAKKEEYDFYLPYYMIIVCERAKRHDTSIKMIHMIIRQKYLNSGPWWINCLIHNIQFLIKDMPDNVDFLDSILEYIYLLRKRGCLLESNKYDILDMVIARYRPLLTLPMVTIKPPIIKNKIKVLLSITTCKRLDLFEQTMNSILRTWKDLDKIDYFFCVDDNSSAEDRKLMQTKYPFFNYYMKSKSEKGHRESMNIIWLKLKELEPTYWIHLEDDWLYFKSENYVTNAINMLEKYEDKNVHQIVFNRIYGLMMKDMDRNGGIILEPGILLHEKKEGVQGKNCAYWPHYSLQPSMVRTKKILELGNYTSPNTFFERDYADKYFAKGYQTIFFDFIFSLHIGKQHWEKDGKNAYALNNIGQFKVPESEMTTIEIIKKEINGPLNGTMHDHLVSIISKIKSGTYFGLIRPSDGEYQILKGRNLTNCDNWTFNGGILQKQLLEAVKTRNPNLYIGIPCNTCNKPWNCTDEIYNDYMKTFEVPLEQRTYANILGNSNWKEFTDFLKSYENGFILITSGRQVSDLPIKERFLINYQLVNKWNDEHQNETERLLKFISNKKNELICFSAGPLSKIWIPMCMALNPENMYLDVGASIDIFTKGSTNRKYTDYNHPFSKESCAFQLYNPIVKKNLIYMCVFHNKEYLELLKILLITVKFYSNTDGIDFLVLTTKEFEPLIKQISDLVEIPLLMKFFDFTSMHEASCARLYIFDYENIDNYEKILYIDTDIIIQNDLHRLFELDIGYKVHGMKEGTIEHEYHGGWFFDFTKIDKDIPGMNGGILLFRNIEPIRIIFNDINAHIKEMKDSNKSLPACLDQPFINYHLVKNNRQQVGILEPYGTIYCIDPPPPPSAPTQVVLCHFVWPVGNAQHKKNRMIQHMNHILLHYKFISPSVGPFPSIEKTYSWNNGQIRFGLNSILYTTWGNGTYEWLDQYTLKASWNGYSHILRMDSTYSKYRSIRISDMDYVLGRELETRIPLNLSHKKESSINQIIPRIIMQTYKTNIIHPFIYSNIYKMLERNQTYDYMFITDERGIQLIKDNFDSRTLDAFSRLNLGAAKADFLRYIVMYLYGGVYLDLDSSIEIDLDTFIKPDAEFIFFMDWCSNIQQWCFMTKPKNPIIKAIIEEMILRINANETNIFIATGPTLFTDVIYNSINNTSIYNTTLNLSKELRTESFTKNTKWNNGYIINEYEDSNLSKFLIYMNGYKKSMIYPNDEKYIQTFNSPTPNFYR